MNTDNLNFRGKFKQYDADGNVYIYNIGDVVEYKGQKYAAVRATSGTTVPGNKTNENTWKAIAAGSGFYIQDDPPVTQIAGDRWYRPTTSIMYTLINQDNNFIWVEL